MLTMVKIAIKFPATKEALGNRVREPAAERAQFAHRQGVEEEHVQEEIDHDHDRRADGERSRHVPARVANLLGDVGGCVPPRIAEHHGNQRHEPARRGDRRRLRAAQVAPVPRPKREANRNEDHDGRNLEGREHVVHEAPGAVQVNCRERRNGRDRDDGLR
jgi:hypothetical protein